MKKLIIGLCAALGVSSAFATWTYSNKTLTDGDWTLNCTPSGTSLTITSIKTAGSDGKTLDFTDVSDGYSIVALGNNALKNVKIASVIMPNTITSIGASTFAGATGLESVTLSTSLTSIGGSAFDGCSKLKTVTPLFPSSLTSVGAYAFRNCALLEGDVVMGTSDTSKPFSIVPASTTYNVFSGCAKVTSFTLNESCFVNNGTVCAFFGTEGLASVTNLVIRGNATSIVDYAFRKNYQLKSVTLPETIQTIGIGAFNNCTALTTITPLLPAAVSSIGYTAFYGCSKLSGDLYIATNGTTVTFGTNAGSGNNFDGCACISNITMGARGSTVPQYCFKNMTGLQTVTYLNDITLLRSVFSGTTPREHQFYETCTWNREASYSSFGNAGGWKTRFVIPADNSTWQAFYTDSTQVKPVSQYTEAETNKYQQTFQDGTLPLGNIKNLPKETWIVARKIDVKGKHPLTVRGIVGSTDVDFGTTDPEYGAFEDVKVPFECSANEYATNGLTLYRCGKSVIEEYDADNTAWINAVTNSGLAYTHNPPKDGVKYRLSWIWEPVAYQANFSMAETLGSITEVSKPDLHGFYTPGQTATYTAVSGGGTFERWYGDFGDNDPTNATISVVCAGEMDLRPYFATNWYYNSTAGTISDGNWTIKVTADGSLLAANSVSESVGAMVVDFAKPISDGEADYSVKSLGISIFNNNTYLNEVRLPPTLTSVGQTAFNYCTNLEKVEPFLPKSVTYVGYSAFCGCAALKSKLELGVVKSGDLVTLDVHTGTYQGWNFGRCDSLPEATFGKSVTSLPTYSVSACANLQKVTFLGDVNIGQGAFSSSSPLKEVVFNGSATWVGGTYCSFPNGNKASRFVVPCENASWQAYYTDTTKVKPYKDLTDAEKDAYTTAFPDGTKPYGLTKASPANEWIVLRRTGAFTVILR